MLRPEGDPPPLAAVAREPGRRGALRLRVSPLVTYCVHGGRTHEFPYEDETGAYCEAHGVTLLWRGDPITADDLTPTTVPDESEG